MSVYSSATLPTRATLWHDESTVTAGNALATTLTTSQSYNQYSNQNAAANGDAFTQSLWLRAGTYTLSVLGITQNDGGKIDWYLGTSSSSLALVASGQDWYSVATTYNVKQTATITVPEDGYHVLKGVVNGHNAGSAGYAVRLTKITFAQSAD